MSTLFDYVKAIAENEDIQDKGQIEQTIDETAEAYVRRKNNPTKPIQAETVENPL